MFVLESDHSWLHFGVHGLTAIVVHNQPSYTCNISAEYEGKNCAMPKQSVHFTQFHSHSGPKLLITVVESAKNFIQLILSAIICQIENKSVIRRWMNAHDMHRHINDTNNMKHKKMTNFSSTEFEIYINICLQTVLQLTAILLQNVKDLCLCPIETNGIHGIPWQIFLEFGKLFMFIHTDIALIKFVLS